MAAHDIQPIRQTPEEELMIEREFQALLDDYRRTNHRQKIERITRAFNFARMAHQGIRRRSGEPYIMHPLAVARIVVGEIGLGSTSICAALLHDVVEDTDYTVDDIRNMFDDKIAQIVDGVTKISGGVLAEEASKQAENFRKLLLTMSKDVRVVLVKLADRLHNMRTLGSMPPHKQLKIAGETEYIYAPLANRLGLHAIKAELENLCFHYEHPELYDDICERLAKDRQGWEAYFEQFVAPIREKFDAEGFHYEIKSRIKSPYSVWRKMSEHNLTYDDVYDVMAVRVIFDPWDRNETEYKQCWHLYAIMT
ncbi:MAG: bifunctional (p)ppGpp synthetase/guanosine-3',5'-bis(diphosphate) 3'-pyrophosphohydrolase, partial [Paludibacteraceae bacterium]|nr:bifunctional (p)ppGpp synthetase/guanosine-3',5'-bis(diphosphate) 3'-pyrophosphohydrolase [Paludibacteraceae bacterium]